jgi:hypothetical protein
VGDQIFDFFADRQTRICLGRNTTHAPGRVGLQNRIVNWSDKGGDNQLQPDPVRARVAKNEGRTSNIQYPTLNIQFYRKRFGHTYCGRRSQSLPRALPELIVTVRAAWFRLRSCSKRR